MKGTCEKTVKVTLEMTGEEAGKLKYFLHAIKGQVFPDLQTQNISGTLVALYATLNTMDLT